MERSLLAESLQAEDKHDFSTTESHRTLKNAVWRVDKRVSTERKPEARPLQVSLC